jgi:hypothetical protein
MNLLNLTAVNASVTRGYSTDPDVRQFIMLNSPFVTVTKMKNQLLKNMFCHWKSPFTVMQNGLETHWWPTMLF